MRSSRRLAVAFAAAAMLGLALAGPQAAAAGPTPGAPGGGDRLFPGLGNGGYDAKHYDLSFRYDATNKKVAMKSTMTATATQALSRFNLDFDGNTIGRVSVDGHTAHFSRSGAELVVTPPAPIAKGQRFAVKVAYVADPRAKHQCPLVPPLTGSAWLPTDDGFGLAGQPNCEHSAYPSNDVPSDKATYTIAVDTPKALQSVANGTLRSTRTSGSRVVRTFSEPAPIATELVQVAVGDFKVYKHTGPHGLPLRDVVPAKLFADSKYLLDKEKKHLQFDEAQIGARYPFETYGSLGLEADFGFALENQTISLYPAGALTVPDQQTRDVIETIMVHELAHQWFGDSVSPKTWSDVWQNEGHATWYEQKYGDQLGLYDFTDNMKNLYADGDQYRHDFGPVAKPTSYQTMFSDQVYGGGALALFALHEKVGDKTFRTIERTWVTKYANKSPGTADYIATASKVSGQNLGPFLRAWLYGTTTPPMPGHPDWKVDPVGSGNSTRSATAPHGTYGDVTLWRR